MIARAGRADPRLDRLTADVEALVKDAVRRAAEQALAPRRDKVLDRGARLADWLGRDRRRAERVLAALPAPARLPDVDRVRAGLDDIAADLRLPELPTSSTFEHLDLELVSVTCTKPSTGDFGTDEVRLGVATLAADGTATVQEEVDLGQFKEGESRTSGQRLGRIELAGAPLFSTFGAVLLLAETDPSFTEEALKVILGDVLGIVIIILGAGGPVPVTWPVILVLAIVAAVVLSVGVVLLIASGADTLGVAKPTFTLPPAFLPTDGVTLSEHRLTQHGGDYTLTVRWRLS